MNDAMDGQVTRPVGYGLIGAGAFGRFCVEQYRQLESVEPVALADVNAEVARASAERLGLDACETVDTLLGRDDVDLVHVATPPATHADVVMRALEAGKHVLCEKPLAIRLDDAKRMVDAAASGARVLAVNLIMRYDPLCEAVKAICEQHLLGEPLHGFFENYAKDEPLPPDHWFWNRELSGGIFIEHGVHFFDLFEWWLGDGEPAGAQQVQRPGADLIEQVQATVRYGGAATGPLVSFYHGFTQAARMDRQEMRLVFERGSLSLYEWVPTSMTIDCLADDPTLQALRQLLPGCDVTEVERYEQAGHREVVSRHKPYTVDGRYRLAADVGMDKDALYGHVLRALLDDKVKAIVDPSHDRRVTAANGYRSLATADRATQLAGQAFADRS